MSDVVLRGLVAAAIAVALASGLIWAAPLRRLPTDLVLTGYAATIAALGVYAVLGEQAGLLAAGVIAAACVVGGLVYALLALASRWSAHE